MKTLGVIGFGDFGRLAAQQLAGRFAVGAHDPHVGPAAIEGAGAKPI